MTANVIDRECSEIERIVRIEERGNHNERCLEKLEDSLAKALIAQAKMSETVTQMASFQKNAIQFALVVVTLVGGAFVAHLFAG
ncbi:MAG: hypothetical protein TUN42_04225 [Dehalogenimonas sp.]